MAISKIYFRGHDTSELTGVTVASCDYGDTEIKRSDEDIAGRDGDITSHVNGRRYKPRQITIVFNVLAAPTALEAAISALRTWLSGGIGELTDDYNTGWKLTNADFASAHTDYIDMFRGAAQVTVKMTSDPYWLKAGTSCERALKFTDSIGANESAAIAVSGSNYTLTKSDSTTVTGTLPSGTRKYRVTAYSEQVPTVTLGQTDVLPDEIFTLPDSGTITITGAGRGYFELWRDDREVRL